MKKILRNKIIAAMKELPQSVKAEADSQLTQRSVSYTHLTLPTILLV